MDHELREAYRHTTYVAATPRGRLRVRIGEEHPELDELLDDLEAEQWAYITAWNPGSEPLSPLENHDRQKELEAELDAAGYALFRGSGVPDDDGWQPEESVLVVGISQTEAARLGAKYGQNAVVFGRLGAAAELVWCPTDRQKQQHEVYFFHGLESAPHGTKYQRLSEDFEVTSPDFQGMDIWERLAKAEQVTEGKTGLMVVGSSFGGLLAALLYSRHPERFKGYVLMAPALYREAADEVERMPDKAVVIHGVDDEVVPIDDVKDKCAQLGVEVTEVDDDHRLHNSLDKMVEAVRALIES